MKEKCWFGSEQKLLNGEMGMAWREQSRSHRAARTKHRGGWLSLLGERCAGEEGLHPVRMCKVVMAHDKEPAECHKFGAQSGFGKKKLSQ